MRTTIEINDALARRVRAVMARRGTTLRALVEEGLRHVVAEGSAEQPFRMRDASTGRDGLVDDLEDGRWETLARVLYRQP
jgi:Arc/MetJ family transcription regulator